jgi:protease-4
MEDASQTPQEPTPGAGMQPANPPPETSPAAAPANGHAEHPAGARRVKRRLMVGLLGLYAASVLAASFLVIRGQSAPPPSRKGEKGAAAGGLLSLSQTQESVGWVPIHGAIYSSESGKPWEKGEEQWARKIKQMSETKGVKAIVLDINSPGGSVGAVQELYSQIQRVRKEKKIPIVALFGDISASGGYYIASACDKIVAHPGTLTGSIGVIFSVSNLQGLFQKIGYKQDPIKSGAHKDIGSPARPMTAEERKIMQDLIDDAYGQFLEAVAGGRHMTVEQVRPLADGRIFSGTQALKAGLVDQLGDSTDAVELAAKLGGIQGKPKVRRDTERFSDIFDMLETKFMGRLTAGAPDLIESLKPHAGLEYRWGGW